MRRFLLRTFLPSPGVCAAFVGFVVTLARPNNPDTLWHMALGRWILTNRSIPDINRFYYSATSGFGHDYSWLSQVILFGAYRLLGGAGIAILNSVVAGFIFYLLYKLLERDSVNLLVNFAVLVLGLMTILAYLAGRPAIFTVALFALEVFLLSDFVRSGRKLIWLIPPAVAVWTNLHPGFLIAPLVILLFLPLGRQARERRLLAACLAAAAIAIVFNPYGWKMYLMPLETARALPMLRGLSEWNGVTGWMTLVWGLLIALLACGFSLRRQPIVLMLLVALLAVAAGVSDRNMPLFGVVAVFAIGRTLLPVLSPALGRTALIRKFSVQYEGAGGWFWVVAVPLVLAVAASLRASPLNLDFDFSGYPTAAVRHIESCGCPGNLFVRETWSSYLLWTAPGRKLFFDAKGGFSRTAAEDHSELVKPKTGWRDVADRNGVSTFLLQRESPLAVVLSEAADWRREYSDSLSVVFVRSATKPADQP